MAHPLSPQLRTIWRIATVVQIVMGFTMGLYLFTYGPLFYEKFSHVVDAKLAMTLTTLLFVVSNALIALLEVPTGAIADTIGRKKTVVWSLVFRMMFFLFLGLVAIASSFSQLLTLGLLAVICFSFSYTLHSGSFTAWCVDSLRSTDSSVGYEHLLSSTYNYSFIAQIFGGVLGVVLYLQHIPYVGFMLAAAICVACIYFCLGEMQEDTTNTYLQIQKISLPVITKRIGEIIGVGFQTFRQSRVIGILVLIFASYLFVINVVDYLWPVYLRSKVPQDMQSIHWILLVVLTLLASSFGSQVFKYCVSRKSNGANLSKTNNIVLRRWLIGTCIFAAVPIIVLSWLTNQGLDTFWYFVSAIIPVTFAYGVIAPCFETLINNHIPETHSQERATIISFGSLVRSVFVMLLAIPSGGTSGETTTIGWAIPAGLLLGMTLIGYYWLKKEEQSTSVASVEAQHDMSQAS